MAISSHTLRLLAAAGLTSAQVAEIVESIEADMGGALRGVVTQSVTPDRLSNAERQRLYRDRKRERGQSVTPVVTAVVTAVTPDPSPLDPPFPSSEPPTQPPYNPPSLEISAEPAAAPVRKRAKQAVLALEPAAPKPGKLLFDEGWDAYPITGRRRSSKAQGHPFWARAAKNVGGEDVLLGCIRRFAGSAQANEQKGRFVEGFHLFLKNLRAENWKPDVDDGDNDGWDGAGAAPRGRGDQRADNIRSLYEGIGEGFD